MFDLLVRNVLLQFVSEFRGGFLLVHFRVVRRFLNHVILVRFRDLGLRGKPCLLAFLLRARRFYFRIAGRKRDEGVISQVEFLDARTSLTAAELNLNAVRFELLARQADLDYATGAPRS